MNIYSFVVAGALIGLFSFAAGAQSTQSCQNAIYQQDIRLMLTEANKTPDNERAVIDALCCDFDLGEYSYEQLSSWQQIVKSEVISDMIAKVQKHKEAKILNEIRGLTAEEFVAYGLEFPQRRELLSVYADSIFLPHIDELSLKELIYYDDYMSGDFHDKILSEIGSRGEETNALLKQQATDYKNYEKKLTERLKYLIEYNLWTFYVTGHQELNNAYSEIGIVPDDPYLAAEQYQKLVKICFPTQLIRENLQVEVDKYCAEINKARKEYYAAAGEKKYSKLSYTVPEFSLKSHAAVDPLRGIAEARERYIRNREDVSTGTSVLGWLFGGVVGLVAQGIGDWFAIDGLVSSEFNARKQYMEGVQQELLTSFLYYSNTVITGIDKSL